MCIYTLCIISRTFHNFCAVVHQLSCILAVVNLTTGQPCTSMDIHGLPRNSTCACSRAESWTRESWRDRSSPHSLGVDIVATPQCISQLGYLVLNLEGTRMFVWQKSGTLLGKPTFCLQWHQFVMRDTGP